ncbi:hypothetical protein BDW22DRAFT_1081793 [Trametopsis cervina]|nr:hypothetical protein BDW22DRAFT_1081793 [Trametopsis cervina]
MHRATPSTSSGASSSSHKPRRIRYTREQLLKSLEILGPLSTLLPATLPPSPPSSRSSSPAPGSKRKSDIHSEQSPSKRPRTTTEPETHRHQSSSQPVAGPSNHAPEDGELREDIPVTRHALDISNVPIRRPRRGTKLPPLYFDELYDKYHGYGRMLKYSGDVRLLSTHPSGNAAFRPLLDPPPPQSSYHKYGNLIARLELIDALVNFAYSIWAKDYSRSKCSRGNWASIEGFLAHCKRKWQIEDGADEREKALMGLIFLIEAFVHGRLIQSMARGINIENERAQEQLLKMHQEELAREAAARETETSSMATPPMLPSPASITTSNSANSTPTPETGAPPATKASAESSSSGSSNLHIQDEQPKPEPPAQPPAHITIPVNWGFMAARKYQSGGLVAAAWCMSQSQRTLTLPIMAKHFPRTFQRMIHSTFSSHDEHEPDIEDDDGELFWPGQLVTGQGLGWVCTMGKAMIKELGKEFGYRGIDGIIPKPPNSEGEGDATTPAVPLHASTPLSAPDPLDAPSSVQR